MKKLLTISTLLMLFVGLISCNVSGITGSKNVIKKSRTITESFNAIKVSQGINVYLKQSDNISVTVEADDNIYDLLITEVKDNVLHIYFDKNVGRVKAKNVYVSMKEIVALTASSGADIEGSGKITGNTLKLKASSGADIELEVDVKELTCSSSSGSDIDVSGICNILEASSSSGSDIDAGNLKSNKVDAESSSGSDITVFVVESLKADASSGADIIYKGEPKEKDIEKSSGGSVSGR